MMRHSVSKQIVATSTSTTAAVGSAVLLAPATSLFSSLSTGSSRGYFTTSSLNLWENNSNGRRTTRLSSATTTSPGAGGISPSVRSPILVGCAMACVATPLISVRNFSSNNNTTPTPPAGNHRFSISSPSISEGAPVPHSTEEAMVESWKIRAETAEKHLQELKSVLDRSANPSSRSTLHHGDGSAKMQKHKGEGEEGNSSEFASSIADDEAKRKKDKEKELEEAFKSIASGATKIFEEFTARAHQSGCPAFQENSGNNNSHWEEQASKHCKHSHCRKTGKCHYGCQARHTYHHHGFHAKNGGPRFNSKNFCKPIRHRRSLPTRLAMMGFAGLVVYGLGCLAMMVGTMLMVGAVIVPVVVLLGFYYVLNQESFFNSHCCFWDGQEKKANQDTLPASSSSDKATNTDWSLVCRK